MKKTVERPSQKNVATGVGVQVVADIPVGSKEIKNGGTSTYITYDEVSDAAKINCFKPTITVKPNGRFLLNDMVRQRNTDYTFQLRSTKMISVRYRLSEIYNLMVDAIGKFAFEEINQKRFLDSSMKEQDAEYRLAKSVVKSVKFANSKEKEFIAILDKDIVVNAPSETNNILGELTNDPYFQINRDVIPGLIKLMAVEPFDIKHYGSDLVVVLDINKVISNCVVESLIVSNKDLYDISECIKLGNTIYNGGFVNTILTIDGVAAAEKNLPANKEPSTIQIAKQNFTCARFQFDHMQLRSTLLKRFKSLDSSADIMFVRNADVAGQPSGAEAIRAQMIGLPDGVFYSSLPLIKIQKNLYTVKFKSTGNGLLDSLISSSKKAEIVDSDAILAKYGALLNGKVYSFNVGNTYGDLCILPNYRNLVAMALFGISVFDEANPPKIDIADNGYAVAVAVSI